MNLKKCVVDRIEFLEASLAQAQQDAQTARAEAAEAKRERDGLQYRNDNQADFIVAYRAERDAATATLDQMRAWLKEWLLNQKSAVMFRKGVTIAEIDYALAYLDTLTPKG